MMSLPVYFFPLSTVCLTDSYNLLRINSEITFNVEVTLASEGGMALSYINQKRMAPLTEPPLGQTGNFVLPLQRQAGVFTPTLEMKQLKHREVSPPACGHSASLEVAKQTLR